MNKILLTLIILILIVIAGGVFLLGGDDRVEESNMIVENVTEDNNQSPDVAVGEYELDSEASEATWTGRKSFIDGYEDHGTIELSVGTLVVTETQVSGEIIADTTTISAVEVGGPLAVERLTVHLQSEDFFDVANHPTAQFEITSLAGGLLSGDLTIKGMTHALAVPVVVTETENTIHFAGTARIDRSQYDVRYGSGSFFDNLGDNTIDDIFDLNFSLTFSKEVAQSMI